MVHTQTLKWRRVIWEGLNITLTPYNHIRRTSLRYMSPPLQLISNGSLVVLWADCLPTRAPRQNSFSFSWKRCGPLARFPPRRRSAERCTGRARCHLEEFPGLIVWRLRWTLMKALSEAVMSPGSVYFRYVSGTLALVGADSREKEHKPVFGRNFIDWENL